MKMWQNVIFVDFCLLIKPVLQKLVFSINIKILRTFLITKSVENTKFAQKYEISVNKLQICGSLVVQISWLYTVWHPKSGRLEHIRTHWEPDSARGTTVLWFWTAFSQRNTKAISVWNQLSIIICKVISRAIPQRIWKKSHKNFKAFASFRNQC